MELFDPKTERLYYELGQNIRELREAKGLTQEQVAGHLEMSRANLNDLESGGKSRSAVSLHIIYGIADALNATPGELLPTLFIQPSHGDDEVEADIPGLPDDADADDRRWAKAVINYADQNFRRDPRPQSPFYGANVSRPEGLLSLTPKITSPPVLLDLIARKVDLQVIYVPHRGEKKIAGFKYRPDDNYWPVRIGINSLIPRTRQRFTLAYFILHSSRDPEFVREFPFFTSGSFKVIPEDDDHSWDKDWALDVMALLMPLNMLRKDLHGQLLDFEDGEVVTRLATRYQVTPTLMTLWLVLNFGGQQKE